MATFRAIIAAIIADDGSSCLPIRAEHLRYLGVGKNPATITLDTVSSVATGGVNQGGNDPYMSSEWDKITLHAPAGAGSQWFRSETNNEWHAWGVIVTPDMIVSRDEE